MARHRLIALLGLLGLLLAALITPRSAEAQCVSLTTLGSASTQTFDTLANAGTNVAWTDNSTIPGWYSTRTTYNAGTGSSNTGALYSFGVAGTNPVTDRALGGVGSGGTGTFYWAGCFTNNTGTALTSADIAYLGEQWRDALPVPAAAQTIAFEFQVAAPGVITDADTPATGWSAVTSLNFTGPIAGTAATALDGNAAANRTAKSWTITVAVPIGSQFWVRWRDINDASNDHGLAIDDFSITPQAAAAVNLTVNDVSLNEGNAGTTTFTFTVSLSMPAGAGGVTFDIATADNTAIAPGDYTTKTLAAQTIPAGSSTYTFDVLVNGDLTPETNETFFVNVTNVTGATVTDGQGQGTAVNDDAAPNLTLNDVSVNEGNAGTTTFSFTVSLSAPAPVGGVSFDIATANSTAVAPGDYTANSLLAQTIAAGNSTYTFDVLVNGDVTPESNEIFFVNVTNVTNAIATDGQGQGTILNDDLNFIHDVQGSGSATPIPGATVTVEGVVTADFQGSTQLQGFFLQEEDADADADPLSSEGVFVFCNTCPTAVAEGQRVRVTGTVSEFFNKTEITASTGGSVVVTEAGNHLAEVTPVPIDLPIVGVVDTAYEAREGMRVTFVDALSVSEYFELARFGQIELYEGGRPLQFTELAAPSAPGLVTHLDGLARRRVILDDDNNAQNVSLTQGTGFQFIYPPRANGGFSVGTQGTDFFRGGDLVNSLTGVLDWSFAGFTGTDAWRVRPTAATPATFSVVNSRPATPPVVGGAIKAVGMNLLNYFTTIDTTASTSSGPCGPDGLQDCRGADSVAELNRQRERASIVICTLNADVYGLVELENTTASATITDLLGAVNARCGGAQAFAFVNTGGTLGTDAIRVQLIYRTGVLSPVGSPLSDLDPIHNRPPTAQTFDVVDATNPAFGQRFTVVAHHFKSKGCGGSSGADADMSDGQGCFAARRTAQSTRLLTWITGTVLPAAGDSDVLLLGDFNSYAQEPPVTTLTGSGYTDIATALLGPNAYSYLFDGQLGHLDFAFSSASLTSQVTGVGNWHINADEADLFDYNDEILDVGESAFEEKPDGSALVPPRVLFQPATAVRASDHDPVLVGLFAIADLSVTKVDTPDPVTAGTNLTYTVTVANAGPDAAANASFADTLPAGTTFVSLASPGGWSCTTPAVGAGGTVSCSNASFGIGNAVFTLVLQVDAAVAGGTVISNTATASSATGDPNAGNGSATATTTVAALADLVTQKTAAPNPVAPGGTLTYGITVGNNGPSNAQTVTLADTLPPGTTFVSLASEPGWSCTTPAVGSGGAVNCSVATLPVAATASFTLVVQVGVGVTSGSTLTNTATAGSATPDGASGNESGVAAVTVAGASADLSILKADSVDPVTVGSNLTYTLTVSNEGPSTATSVSMSDPLPAETTFVSLSSPAGWSCTTPAVGATGTVTCSIASFAVDSAVFAVVVQVNSGTQLTNTAGATATSSDPQPGNESATEVTTVGDTNPNLSIAITDAPDPVDAGSTVTYTVTATSALAKNSNVVLTDVLPAQATFQSLVAPAGAWGCTTPAVGATGSVVCTRASWPGGTVGFAVTVTVPATVPPGTVLQDSASIQIENAGRPFVAADAEDTAVNTPATLSATKVATGSFEQGSIVTYTLVVTNAGPATQANNPGDELTDVLPPELALVSATATSGTAGANFVDNTVTWNGSLAPGASVTITITAFLPDSLDAGLVISNQAQVSFDADGNGSNEAAASSDDPGVGGGGDPTDLVVVARVNVLEIPTLGEWGLIALAGLLALAAALRIARRD